MADTAPVALITGVNRRIGHVLCRHLHRAGYTIALHHGPRSGEFARSLASDLNRARPDSARTFPGDLRQVSAVESLARSALEAWGRIDALVNNASSFYPTPLESATEAQWDDLMGSNLKGPFFLSRALAPALKTAGGVIVNIADINGRRPLKDYAIYCMAKAGNIMLTRTLALELAPEVRVNGIAPGSILWPEGEAAMNEAQKQSTTEHIALGRNGSPDDIAALATLMIMTPGYLTGQVVAVDGGLSLSRP